MGQTLKKWAPRTEENKIKEISPIIEKFYDTHFAAGSGTGEPTATEFYRAVCEAVDTHFCVPEESKLKKHTKEALLKREEFQKILQEIIMGTGFTGVGAKTTLIYMFGVPLTAFLLIKQRIMPRAIPNTFFIPAITSATAFVLAKLNKV
ncbi:hypothetical protein D8674_011574 [Pyrus ussuriensis x Pyrus communis]|uniref:Uncharacterized protein n=1 Tax=Pyrus ussuriensis x Pyrus communis TaxID=2448454 RepID=A0A5N5FZ81_9ROSA|nr:hypothetical protein D8674_011574 [Pyrus ussuriensis x Pyrus communis]